VLRTTLIICLAASIAVPALALPATGHPTASFQTTLKLDARFTSSHITGRLEVATDQLSIGHRVVGHDVVDCAKVTSADFECSFTEFLAGHGTLQAEGFQDSSNAPVAMAIVGGTGAYTGATGTMITSNALKSVEHYELHFTLTANRGA
jgi:hypothetical protein